MTKPIDFTPMNGGAIVLCSNGAMRVVLVPAEIDPFELARIFFVAVTS